MLTRREMIAASGAALAGGAIALHPIRALAHEAPAPASPPEKPAGHMAEHHHGDQAPSPSTAPSPATAPGQAGADYTPVITPNNISLPWKTVDGVKVYHLIAEEVEHEFVPGLRAKCWGFNGRVHGPTIEAVEGDRVRIYVTNKLPAATSIHWHGIILPNGMDGVSGLTQPPIKPGETFKYDITLRQHGTHMYHSHHDEMTQMALGLMGLFVIHPRQPKYRVDRDFALMLSECRIDVVTMRPNPN